MRASHICPVERALGEAQIETDCSKLIGGLAYLLIADHASGCALRHALGQALGAHIFMASVQHGEERRG